jgi:kinesin family protein 13
VLHRYGNLRSLIIQQGPVTIIEDPDMGKKKDFTFDYSFWSHDEFEVNEKGISVATGDKYAD